MKNLSVSLRKFDALKGFYALFMLAIVVRLISDISLNRYGIHQGDIFPFHKLPRIPLYSTHVLIFEWIISLVGVGFLFKNKIRFGALLISISYIMSLSQYYQNQKVLVLIISLTLMILPIDIKRPASLKFLKYQVCLIYFISALHKFHGDFLSGRVLYRMFEYLGSTVFMHRDLCLVLSLLTLIGELLMPLILIKRPIWGVIGVIAMHLSFNLFMPDILPFTLTMIALSFLFLLNESSTQKE